jgi:hypothetical protein
LVSSIPELAAIQVCKKHTSKHTTTTVADSSLGLHTNSEEFFHCNVKTNNLIPINREIMHVLAFILLLITAKYYQ